MLNLGLAVSTNTTRNSRAPRPAQGDLSLVCETAAWERAADTWILTPMPTLYEHCRAIWEKNMIDNFCITSSYKRVGKLATAVDNVYPVTPVISTTSNTTIKSRYMTIFWTLIESWACPFNRCSLKTPALLEARICNSKSATSLNASSGVSPLMTTRTPACLSRFWLGSPGW